MKIDSDDFCSPCGKKTSLRKWKTRVKPYYSSKEHYLEILGENTREMSKLQGLLYAFNRYSVLLIVQAMDAAGKDGIIVPADDKENARLIVSRIILNALGELKMTYPEAGAKRRQELKSIHKGLKKQ